MKNRDLKPRSYPAVPKAGNAGGPAPRQGRPRGPVRSVQRPEGAVQAPQYNVMGAPAWTRGLAPAARPGANDHQRIASHGIGC